MIKIAIEKKVQFDLSSSKVLLSSNLVDEGYAKADIIALFVELDENGYGEYVPGTRGRGTCAKFVKNSSCPAEYTLVMEQKTRGRKSSYKSNSEESSASSTPIEIVTCDTNPVAGQMDEFAQCMNDGDLCNCDDDDDDDDDDEAVLTCTIDSDADLTGMASDLAVVRNGDSEIDEDLLAQGDDDVEDDDEDCEAAE